MPYSQDNQFADHQTIAPSIEEIFALLSQVSERFEPGESQMREWILERFPNPLIAEVLEDATIMMLRVLNTIGQLEPVNGITISKQSRIPKGSVSKITRKLIAKKLISQEALPNNKKEILFRTTALGKEVFLAHRAFDEAMEKSFVQFLGRYSDEERGFMVRVLQDFLNTPLLDSHPNSSDT
jgi:DNA-binding MarR family transcriptional regulator